MALQPQNGPPSSFTLFSELPAEIRRMIWHEAVPGPRVLWLRAALLPNYRGTRVWSDKPVDEVFQNKIPTFFDLEHHSNIPRNRIEQESWEEGDDYGPENNRIGLRSLILPSVLLFVCHESFDVASNCYYTKTFGTRTTFPETWFDFQRDTLYLEESWSIRDKFMDDLSISDTSKVRHLAYYHKPEVGHNRRNLWSPIRIDGRELDYEEYIAEILSHFAHLRKLYLVVEQVHKRSCGGELVLRSTADFIAWHNRWADWSPFYRYHAVHGDGTVRTAPELNLNRLQEVQTQRVIKGLNVWHTIPEIIVAVVMSEEVESRPDQFGTLLP